MSTRCCIMSLVAILAAGLPLRADEGTKGPPSLDGRWEVVELFYEGARVPFEAADTLPHWQIRGDRWTYTFEAKQNVLPQAQFQVALNAGATPTAVDATLQNGQYAGRTMRGICRIEGDTLHLCLPDHPSVPRPTAFATSTNSKLHLMVLRRTAAEGAMAP